MQTKKLLFVSTFFFLFFTTDAQVNLDSLKAVWNNHSISDTIRLKAVNKIATEGYRFKNSDSAFYYAQLQFDLAKSIENKNSMILALNIQGDSYLLKGDPDKALDALSRALKLSEELSNNKLKVHTLGNITRVYESKGDSEAELNYNLQILKLSEELQDKSGIGRSLADIGKNYVRKGNLPTGLEYLIQSKKIFEELESRSGIVRVQSFMANIYMQQGDIDEALKLLTLNLAYFEETDNKIMIAGCLSNIAGIYLNQGDNKKALINLEKSLGYFEETENIPYIASISQNIGHIYYEEGNLERALEYITRSLKLAEETKNENLVAAAKSKIGNMLADQGKYTQAILYGNEALRFFQETSDVRGVNQSSKILVESYKATGNYKKAFEMNELHFQTRDSLNSIENQKAVIQLQVQSDYERRKAVDDLENEKRVAIETQKKENQQKLSIAIGLGLLLISLLALVIFNRLKVTRQQKSIIEEQKKKVEQSEKYKEQFLANMSHEIRTPMHAISGMTNILVRKKHLKHQEKFLNAIRQSSHNLLVILNDILDLSKIEAGKIDINSIPINPRKVVVAVSDLLRVKAEEKGLSLDTELAAEIPEYVYGDPTRLNQILLNLLGNAIKFTEKGSVSITVTAIADKLRFAIQDSGIGIPTDRLEYIFKSFEQVNDSITRKHGGTGLGLTITKQLIELQNGTIWVESQENIGSTFFFELPLLPVEADKKLEGQITDDQLKEMAAALSGLNILVVEDDELNSIIAGEDLGYYLKDVKIGYAENGQLAIQEFETGKYDLILMDIQMPELNGYDATRAIRKIEAAEGTENPISIIAMTASLLKSEINNCYAAGMDNYIPKPYKAEELIGGMYKELKK